MENQIAYKNVYGSEIDISRTWLLEPHPLPEGRHLLNYSQPYSATLKGL